MTKGATVLQILVVGSYSGFRVRLQERAVFACFIKRSNWGEAGESRNQNGVALCRLAIFTLVRVVDSALGQTPVCTPAGVAALTLGLSCCDSGLQITARTWRFTARLHGVVGLRLHQSSLSEG